MTDRDPTEESTAVQQIYEGRAQSLPACEDISEVLITLSALVPESSVTKNFKRAGLSQRQLAYLSS